MEADAGVPIRELRVDGGASTNNLLMQLQADLLGVPVVRPAISETTALGAAYLAGLATGFWESTDQIAAQWQVEARFEPATDNGSRAELTAGWTRAVERAKGWITEK
jgi:glycerol kinase